MLTILTGDSRVTLRTLPDASVNCCVTSPPYYGLRSYLPAGHESKALEIGGEETPEEYVSNLVTVFREVRRILRNDGVAFLNIGDTYQNGLTVLPQTYRMREDISGAEKMHVAMEMFGVWFNGNEPQGKGPLPEVLSGCREGRTVCGGPGMEGEGVEKELRTQQGEGTDVDARKASATEMDSHRDVGREVRVLRGRDPGVSDSGSHQRRRCCSQERSCGEQQGEQHQDLSGHSEPGVPEGKIQSAVLQLQLFNRLLGILSAHTFQKHEIPDTARFAFAPVVSLKPKDLIGIPWRVAFALQADGWYLRQDIIWAKPNPMPESVTDRPTRSHETVFLLTKSSRYWYDSEAVKEPAVYGDHPRNVRGMVKAVETPGQPPYTGLHAGAKQDGHSRRHAGFNERYFDGSQATEMRNLRDVWTFPIGQSDVKHYAMMPPEMAKRCILAGCPSKVCAVCGAPWEMQTERTDEPDESAKGSTFDGGKTGERDGGDRTQPGQRFKTRATGLAPTCTCNGATSSGTVLDPFGGSGTTGKVAIELGRRAILCELNTEYIGMIEQRTQTTIGMGL